MSRFLKINHLLVILILTINQLISVSNANTTVITANRSLLRADFTTFYGLRSGCCPFHMQFQDSSSSTAGNIIEWKWYFGDGDSSPLQNPDHVYHLPGNYDVTLVITTDSGYSDQITKTGYINCASVPDVDFIPRPSLAYLSKPTIYFENLTKNETLLTTYFWHFDDQVYPYNEGGTSYNKNPSWKYSDTGHYHVMLVATNEINCSDTTIREVTIIADPHVLFPTYYFHKGYGSSGCFGNYIYEFYPIFEWGVVEMHIEVFNLSGTLVFRSDDPKNTRWEGTYLSNNSPAASEMYIIRIKYKGFDDIWYTKTGKIILQR